MPSIFVYNAQNECLAQSETGVLVYAKPYQEGDYLVVSHEGECRMLISVDQTVQAGFVYLPEGKMTYRIPFGESMRAYPPNAFQGPKHVITARLMTEEEIHSYRNIALNPIDQRGDVTAWPHATANVETRGESVFAAHNVIDGWTINHNHGDWPFQSWGIGLREDAWLKIDFGRPVQVNAIEIFLRADFPHDAYWTNTFITLSDGSEFSFDLIKTGEGQKFDLGEHTITWLQFDRMTKCTDSESPFPALTELRVFGRE